jgi:hypothetical protein
MQKIYKYENMFKSEQSKLSVKILYAEKYENMFMAEQSKFSV